MRTYGIHPDVVFGEISKQEAANPYVQAMDRWREMHPTAKAYPKHIREALIAEPSKYGLTDEQLDAVKRVMSQLSKRES